MINDLKIDDNLWNVFKKEEEEIPVNDNNKLNDYCEYCKNFTKVNENNLIVCKTCGTIDSMRFDTSAEWRYYGTEDNKYIDPTRCGLPTNELLPESSLGSIVSYKYDESYDMKKIRNYHGWNAMPYKERSLYNVFDSIQLRAINSGIPSCIIEEAKIMYKSISETQISRGANRKGIIASCIYKACKLKNVPRSAKEIADIFQLNVTNMTRGCKRFDEIMNINKKNNDNITLSNSDSNNFVKRFCSYLNIGDDIYEICKFVCESAEKYYLVSENTPPSIAAGSIYLVCNILKINISKKDISNRCKISEVTISKCYKRLFKYHQHLLPTEILEQI
jgi:transcription initiation factor TFIIB